MINVEYNKPFSFFRNIGNSSGHEEHREAWYDFGTSNWINIIKYPESFIQQGLQLLSVVNVQI